MTAGFFGYFVREFVAGDSSHVGGDAVNDLAVGAVVPGRVRGREYRISE